MSPLPARSPMFVLSLLPRQAHLRALANYRIDPQVRANGLGTFAHDGQAQVIGCSASWIESPSVVPDV